jgi:hypothetical protein
MDKDLEKREARMRMETNASYCEVPIVARSPSYQQPVEEAVEQTRMALRQRAVKRGS